MKKYEQAIVYQLPPDPSEKQGFQQIFQQQVLFKIQNKQQQKKIKQYDDWILFRLFVTKSKTIKIQITSQLDILFFYLVTVEWESLENQLKQKQISIKFSELSKWWGSIFEDKNNTFLFEVLSDFQGVLSINQKLSYKNINLLNLIFIKTDPEQLKLNIMNRYQRMQRKKSILYNILLRGNILIKRKNPTLLHDRPKKLYSESRQKSKQKFNDFKF